MPILTDRQTYRKKDKAKQRGPSWRKENSDSTTIPSLSTTAHPLSSKR